MNCWQTGGPEWLFALGLYAAGVAFVCGLVILCVKNDARLLGKEAAVTAAAVSVGLNVVLGGHSGLLVASSLLPVAVATVLIARAARLQAAGAPGTQPVPWVGLQSPVRWGLPAVGGLSAVLAVVRGS